MGWVQKTMGELKEGDIIKSPTGPTEVRRAYDEHIPERMFEVEDDNGNIGQFSGNHLFYIETEIDRSNHSRRIVESRKVLKKIEKSKIQEMRDYVATHNADDHDMSLSEIIDHMGLKKDQDVVNTLQRIAASVGTVAEDNYEVRELYDMAEQEGVLVNKTIQKYSQKEVFDQILSIIDKKKRNIIVGRVVNTITMLEEMESQNIYLPDIKNDTGGIK